MAGIGAGTDRATRSANAAVEERVRNTLAAEEREGLKLEIRGRTIALIAVMGITTIVTPYPAFFFYYGLILVFMALGFVRLWADGSVWRRAWHPYAFVAVDFALLAFTLVFPNPLSPIDYPPQLSLRFNNAVYLQVLMVGLAFSFQPRLVLWAGLCGAVSWAFAIGWLASLPGSNIVPVRDEEGIDGLMRAIADPTYIDLGVNFQNIAVFLLLSGLLAAIVGRSRRLVLRQATLERERSNLARYFPPATVERLASQDKPLAQIRGQNVAVMFVDLRGFTAWSEHHGPADVIALLRHVHGQLEQTVFAHHGTVDKFIGDGMMATFGTPDPGPRDASDALACVHAIMRALRDGVSLSGKDGSKPLHISVGVHYGPVVVGDIGTERRLELAVLGDTVNVASRLEALTRSLEVSAVVSDALIAAARDETGDDVSSLLGGFTDLGRQGVRGRAEPVHVWGFS